MMPRNLCFAADNRHPSRASFFSETYSFLHFRDQYAYTNASYLHVYVNMILCVPKYSHYFRSDSTTTTVVSRGAPCTHIHTLSKIGTFHHKMTPESGVTFSYKYPSIDRTPYFSLLCVSFCSVSCVGVLEYLSHTLDRVWHPIRLVALCHGLFR